MVTANKKVKHHLIIGDFNINILRTSEYSEELVNNFFVTGYLPLFKSVTRPCSNEFEGTCINNYIKSDLNLFALKHASLTHC